MLSNVRIGQMNTSLAAGTTAEVDFEILLRLRDSQGFGLCGNETKPRMLASPGIYKHCNASSDS